MSEPGDEIINLILQNEQEQISNLERILQTQQTRDDIPTVIVEPQIQIGLQPQQIPIQPQQLAPGFRARDQTSAGLMERVMFAICMSVFMRVVGRLLSVSVYSQNILDDIIVFYKTDLKNFDYWNSSLIFKIGTRIYIEFIDMDTGKFYGFQITQKVFKILIIFIYLLYSFVKSSYVVFSLLFFLFFFALTTFRRWRSIYKFLTDLFW